jgi:hypothetical protein
MATLSAMSELGSELSRRLRSSGRSEHPIRVIQNRASPNAKMAADRGARGVPSRELCREGRGKRASSAAPALVEPRAAAPQPVKLERDRWFADSLLEGDGFEPSSFFTEPSFSAALASPVAGYLHP